MNGGLLASTRSVDGFYVGGTWPSFYTATDPSQHGIYWLDRLRAGSYWTRRPRPSDLGERPALWEVLSRAGRRVAVLDVPLSRISPGLRGIQVVEWGVHDAAFGFRTRPRSLKQAILDDVGPHPAPPNCDARRDPAAYRRFADQLIAGTSARERLTASLLQAQDWDFAIQVFSETHCAGHQLWHFHDPRHPAFEAAATQAMGDLLREVYRAVDASIGGIVSVVGDETAVVVLALHGMSHTCGGSLLLPEILERLCSRAGSPPDAADTRGPGVLAQQPARGRPGPSGAIRRAYRRLPPGLRESSYRLRRYLGRRLLGREMLLCASPSSSMAFPVGLGLGATWSGIRLNLKGREPQGLLAQGAEAERFAEWLSAELMAITRPESSMPLARRVMRTSDHFSGPHLPNLPDLLVEWEPEPPMGTSAAGDGAAAVWRAQSPSIGLVEKHNSYCRTGEHRIEGLMIARGAGVTPGRLERTISILDLAPTFARMLDCDMPGTGGTVVPELLGAGWQPPASRRQPTPNFACDEPR
jgi:predicted AlkP superfamily phosphohydrolase/phosphomutase